MLRQNYNNKKKIILFFFLATSLFSLKEATADSYSYESTPSLVFSNTTCPATATTTLEVTDDFSVNDLNIGLNVGIDYRHHLTATLTSPEGTTIELTSSSSYGSGSASIANWDVLFDDSSSNGLNDGDSDEVASPYYENERTANPSGLLSTFNGEDAFGDWVLNVCDSNTSFGNGGTVNRFKLDFDGTPNVIPIVPGEISGSVFHDDNVDGSKSGSEQGIANVVVTGIDSNGNSETTNTNASGEYTLAGLSDGTRYRIEFTNLPVGYFPSNDGTDSHSTVSFVNSPAVKINLGLIDTTAEASGTCSPNEASYAVTRFGNGDPYDASNSSVSAVARFLYSDRGQGSPTSKDGDTNLSDVGSVWGLAYNQNSGGLYMSAVLKRHAGLTQDAGGNPLIGAIYLQTDPTDTSTTSLFYDFGTKVGNDIPNNASRFPVTGSNVGPANTDRSLDAVVYPLVGKRGFGDIDLSTDGSTLYAVNLFDRKLYSVNTSGTPSDSEVTNAPWLDNSICPTNSNGSASGIARPWATKYHEGSIHVGVVCDASTSDSCNASGSCSDLTAHIFSHDGNNWSTVLPTPVSLDYERDFQGYSTAGEYWHPWEDNYSSISPYVSGGIKKYPQPILGDIEFDDDGSIILGLVDRSTHQFGYANSEPNVASPNTNISIFAAGDILRVGFDSSGTNRVLESNGQIYDANGNLLTGGDTTSPTGPGGREFYADRWAGSGTGSASADTTVGSLALLPNSGEVLYTSADRYDYYTAATVFANNIDGSHTGGVTVYQDDSSGSLGTFSKGGGLGDIELMCPPIDSLTVEVGNRVWFDEDGDGLQGANEPGISGVDVQLDCGGSLITTTTATDDPITPWDENGTYYFSGASGENAEGELISGENCTISIDTTQNEISNYSLTTPNTGGDSSNSLTDFNDSDGTLNGNNAETNFIVGNAGENNHTLDFGFSTIKVDLSLTKTINKTTAKRGENVVYTITVSNSSVKNATGVKVEDQLPNKLRYISHTGGNYDSTTGIWDVGSVAAESSKTLNITAMVK